MKKNYTLLVILFTLITVCLSAQDGDLDPSFDTDGLLSTGFTGFLFTSIIQEDGKIIAAGDNGNGEFALARFNPNGTWDSTFGGWVTTSIGVGDVIYSLAIQADGKIIAAGYSTDSMTFFTKFTMTRYDSTGVLDNTFGDDGIVITELPFGLGDYILRSIAIQPDNKIVAGGYVDFGSTGQFVLVRYNENGTLDSAFGTDGAIITNITDGEDRVLSILLNPDTTIVAVGYSNANTGLDDFALTKYLSDGTPDTSFGNNGLVITDFNGSSDRAWSAVLQSDNKIVVAGHAWVGSNFDFALARYNTDGSLDETFGEEENGKTTTAFGSTIDKAFSVALQEDGKIVAAGYADIVDWDFALARYDTAGYLDGTFGLGGKILTDFNNSDEFIWSVNIQENGNIVAAGNDLVATSPSFEYAYLLARYLSELNVGVLDFSFSKNEVLIYPNPIIENATLEFSLKQKEALSIQLIDLQGRIIKTFMKNKKLDAGEYAQPIVLPRGVPSGTYFIVLSTKKGNVSIKIFK
jgi:uncharacterized delta-60 repeat protein